MKKRCEDCGLKEALPNDDLCQECREDMNEFSDRVKVVYRIPWKKYDPTNRSIESHVDHIVTNGHRVLIAQHASVPGTRRYSWMINNALIDWVTHYAPINLPVEE